MVGNQLFSITDGEAVEFKLGKTMLCAQQPSPPRKAGYLLHDCAARALQEAVFR